MNEEQKRRAIALLVVLLGASSPLGLILPHPNLNGRRGAAYNLSQRLRRDFSAKAARLAAKVVDGTLSVNEWVAAFGDEVAVHLVSQSMAGSATTELPAETLLRLNRMAIEQRQYVARFGSAIRDRLDTESAMSEAAVAARSQLYGGAAYGEYWRSSEQDVATVEGYVVYYHAVDDQRTCAGCVNAEGGGPYLIGTGPFPGDVCYGGGRCRCWRETVYDPQAYAALKGAP